MPRSIKMLMTVLDSVSILADVLRAMNDITAMPRGRLGGWTSLMLRNPTLPVTNLLQYQIVDCSYVPHHIAFGSWVIPAWFPPGIPANAKEKVEKTDAT
jgi:hypothetical protein